MDDRLKELFAELRAHERARAPDLDSVLARDRPRARPFRLVRVALAAAVVAVVLLGPWRASPDASPSLTQWRAPTDVLLATPGSALLSEVPVLSESVLDIGRLP